MEALRKQIELDARPPTRPPPSAQPLARRPLTSAAGRTFDSPAANAPRVDRVVIELSDSSDDDDDDDRGGRIAKGGSDAGAGSGSSEQRRRPTTTTAPRRPQMTTAPSGRPSSSSSSSSSWAAPSRFFQKPPPPSIALKQAANKPPTSSSAAAGPLASTTTTTTTTPGAGGIHAAFRPPRFTTPPSTTYAHHAGSGSAQERQPAAHGSRAGSSSHSSRTPFPVGSSSSTSSSPVSSSSRAPSPSSSTTASAPPTAAAAAIVVSRALGSSSSSSSSSAAAASNRTSTSGGGGARSSLTADNPFGVRRPLDVSRPAPRPAFLPSNLDFGPSSSSSSKPKPPKDDGHRAGAEGETFDLSALRLESGDLDRVSPTEADAHMRELLEAAVANEGGAEGGGDFEEGEDVVEGFREGIRLMPHQILGTRWMKARESGRRTGGILGDDMGLGKTVQSLARIVAGPPKKSELRAGWTGGTLIVCPLAVMSQWKHEIESKTTRDLLSVCEHQGGDRTTLKEDLLDYDVVITTYNVVQQEHGNHLAAAAAAAKSSSSAASSTGRKTTTGGRRGSPSGSGSDSDSDGAFGASLASSKAGKKKPAARGRAKATSGAGGAGSAKRALFAVRWHRVILDEAQNIKNRASKTAKACIALESKYRWCLTGTPIQNNIEELYPLFAFLRIRPLNDWDYFKTTIAKPVKEGRTKLAMKKLQLVLGSIMLRRLKTAEVNGKKILNLPARTVTVVKCLFDGDERTFYQALAERTALRMSKFMKAGSVSSNYTSILTMLLRLRQACDHPELVSQSFAADPDAIAPAPPTAAGAATTDDDGGDELAALLGGLSVGSRPTCTVCSEPLAVGTPSTVVVCSAPCAEVQAMAERAKAEVAGLPPSSAKTRMILDILDRVRTRSVGQEKTIIFSQFTKMLDKIEPFLRQAGHKFVRYDGSLRNEDRTRVLDRFRASATTNVILISFKAGSTGLNLTAANHVILVDLWWNPALEEQAFDRAHRLGQTRDVEIYKLAIDETVEDKILALQEKKRELASAALAGRKLNVGKGGNRLGVDELMLLFKGIVSADDDDD